MFRLVFGGKKETFKTLSVHAPGSKREQYSNFTLKTLGSGDITGKFAGLWWCGGFALTVWSVAWINLQARLSSLLEKIWMNGLLRTVRISLAVNYNIFYIFMLCYVCYTVLLLLLSRGLLQWTEFDLGNNLGYWSSTSWSGCRFPTRLSVFPSRINANRIVHVSCSTVHKLFGAWVCGICYELRGSRNKQSHTISH